MNNDSPLLKFHGKFADLIPAGFKFQKLFANNYRQYCLDVDHECIRVWQHHGGYIEIEDWYSATKGVVAAVLNPEFKWHRFAPRNLPGGEVIHCTSLGFTIVRGTGEVIPLDYDKHEAMRIMCNMEREGKSKEEQSAAVDKIYEQFRVDRISLKMVDKIKEFHARGWIKV